jgi:undecaprenyl-diphosphatase
VSPFQAGVLGAVQGLTEFLPISSSGHLVIVPAALGWDTPSLGFDVLLHAASLLAILVYFRREVAVMTLGIFRGGPGRRLVGILLVGTIPAGLVGLLFDEQVSAVLDRPRIVAMLLFGTAAILVVAEAVFRRRSEREQGPEPGAVSDLSRVGWVQSLIVGCGQAAAILPGFSRSGFTISAALGTGMARPQAARFSFLLSMPALTGAAMLEIPSLASSDTPAYSVAVGFVASFVFSYLAVAGLIRYLQRRGLLPFAGYCVLAGAIGLFIFSS